MNIDEGDKFMTVGHGYDDAPLKRINALHLGCGFKRKNSTRYVSWVNVDSSKEVSPDKIWKAGVMNAPFKDGQFDYVESVHSFEHVPNHLFALEEMYRITKSGGVWRIVVPFGWGWQDNLFHKTMGYHWHSFDKFFINTSRKYYSKVRLEPIEVYARCTRWTFLLPFKKLLSYFLNNIYYDIVYVLRVVKE